MVKSEEAKLDINCISQNYEASLQKKIQNGSNVTETKNGLFKGLVVSVCAGILMLGGINYVINNGVNKYSDPRVMRGVSKTTGITTYVEYRKVKVEEGFLEVIINGDILGYKKWYADFDGDKKVDIIGYNDDEILYRADDYSKHKSEFDRADKQFLKYLKELSK
ncbi:hypothetical protein FJZ53_05545 [Candidatus Woesearchaeota archaeon]|nr:hypothetical protein [Candidatus Woesearchaeota archaeon]